MGIDLGSAYGKIEIDASGVQTGVGTATNALGGFSGMISGALSTAIGTLTANAIPKLLEGMSGFITGAMEAEGIQAQLNAVLESTDGAAGMTADAINEIANQLSGMTRFEDDAIVSGQNMLLTFTNIGEEVFPAATETMLDMSAAMGTDLKGTAIQLGKALNDPITGVGALSRVGVTFTEDQKKMIKTMVEAGDVAGAQKLVLAELSREFGGSAEAAGKTFAGQLDILKNSLGNVGETVGAAVLPVLNDLLTTFIMPALPQLQALAETFAANLGPAIMTVATNAQQLFAQWTGGWDGIQAAIQAAMAIIVPLVSTTLTNIQAWWAAHGASVIATVTMFLTGVVTFISTTLANIQAWWAAHGSQVIATVLSLWTTVSTTVSVVLGAVGTYIMGMLASIQAWWAAHGASVIAVVTGLVTALAMLIGGLLLAITTWWQANGDQVMAIVTALWTNVQAVFSFAFEAIGLLFDAFAAAFSGDWETFQAKLVEIWNNLMTAISTGFNTLWTVVQPMLASALTNIQNAFAEIDWGQIGANIIQGIADGIGAAAGAITDAAQNAAQAALDAAKAALGIKSPSAVMAAQVGLPMAQGMIEGWMGALSGASQQMAAGASGLGQSISNQTTNNFNLNAAFSGETPGSVRDSFRFMEMTAR